MTSVNEHGSQLDRIEGSLSDLRQLNAQILDRLTRMEERQNAHATELGKMEARIDDHGDRIRALEVASAVADTTGHHRHKSLVGRWSALSTVSLLVLGAILSLGGKFLLELFSRGGTP